MKLTCATNKSNVMIHCQPETLRRRFERSIPSVNHQPATFKIFRKRYENGPYIQTISLV